MFISDKLIYLQLQKTACTHIAKLLKTHISGEQQGKHGQLKRDLDERLIVGSIRNPWDWYVSLWAYGCQRKGSIYEELTSPFLSAAYRISRRSLFHFDEWGPSIEKIWLHSQKDRSLWNDSYMSSENPEQFRSWLKNILSMPGKNLLMDEYSYLPLSNVAGLMTFRFLRLYTEYKYWVREANTLKSDLDIANFYHGHCIVEKFIKMETLEQDMASLFCEIGLSLSSQDLKSSKSNASQRSKVDYYYDQETIDLVREQESLIIKVFGYVAPRVDGCQNLKNT